MKIVAIIQARMSSTRLPGKVLLDIAGQPMLAHVVERTRLARTVGQVVVATTTDPSDDPIEAPWGRTYPIGLDTEVCTFSALELAWHEATQPHQREHVMPFFYDQPQRFRILHVNHEVDYGAFRWTVDTPEDLKLVRQIFARFPERHDFSWLEVLALFEREPELAQVNAQVKAKDYRQVDTRRD